MKLSRAVLEQAKFHSLAMEKKELYKHDIAAWAKDRLGLHLWSKQREIAAAIVQYKKVAVKSCHGSGKSYFASILVAWWVDTRYGTEAVVVSTAPTYEQVNKILWRYIRQHWGKNELMGNVTQTDEWKDAKGEVVAWGRKPADTNTQGFQGIHSSGGVLAVIDEACGVNETIFTGVEAITTGSHDRILAIANPDIPQSEFGRIFLKNDPSWHKITISAFDTPNFTDEKNDMPPEALSGLVSVEWVEDKKISWGEDSARYKSKILGEFTTDAGNTLFTMETLMRGFSTELELLTEEPPRMGVDVARFGEDYSVAYLWHQGKLRFLKKWSKKDSIETATIIRDLAFENGVKEIRIDGVGLGGPIMDIVSHISDNRYEVVGMIGNASSPDIDKWVNARAYWYDTMREKMYLRQIDMSLDDEAAKDLEDELGTLEYFFSKRGGLQIMDKAEIRKQTGKSPDFADAACYACADLGFDPTLEESKLRVGDEYSMGLEDILEAWESQISPL
jgi:hypothetical protein